MENYLKYTYCRMCPNVDDYHYCYVCNKRATEIFEEKVKNPIYNNSFIPCSSSPQCSCVCKECPYCRVYVCKEHLIEHINSSTCSKNYKDFM